MSITENIDRIEQGKTSIISSIKSKGVNVPSGVLINEIAPYINEIQSGGGDTPDTPKTELVQKYEGATVIRVNIPTDNYEFAINLCNNATNATYDVDWGDNILENSLTTDEQHHTYTKAGIYDINIYNLSKNITLGGYYAVNVINNSTITVYYLFNNSNNDEWGFRFTETKDKSTVTDILIGDKITSIGFYAFSGCSALQSVVITEGVTSISDDAFYNCSALQSVVIPEGVTSISDYAFKGCSALQSVVIPEGVTSISQYAFQNCTSLQSVVIPNSVTSIGGIVFSGCSSLQSVVIPEGVTSIGTYAFEKCSALQSVVIPEGVTSIGGNAFSDCSALQSVVIPEGVTSISQYAFSGCTSLQSVVIPNSVTSISQYAFQNCTSLQSVVIPNSVTSIGNYVFKGCSSLQSVVIPEGVTSISDYAFSGCTSLQSVVIPEGVTSIGGDAFYYCTSLQSVVIPEGVTSISGDAFYYCTSLQSVVIPNSVTSIGGSAFSGCSSLQTITINAMTAPTIQSSSFPTSSFNYTKRYLYVPKDANGYDTSNWKTYLIDKGWELRYIEEHVKTPTTMKLKTVNNFLHKWDYIGGAKLVDYDLIDNEYIYHFDDKIEEIIQYTFYNVKLKEIELPEGVTSIGYYAFYNCTSLQSVVITEGVTSISGNAFYNCTSLQSVVIPEGVTSIGTYAFKNCSSLQSVVIPESVTSIGTFAFENCSALQTITINAMTAPTIQSSSFNNTGIGVPTGTPKILRVPKGATGYDEGYWKTSLINKGYTLEYIEPEEPDEPDTPTEPDEPLYPEVAENEDILVIENVDTTEGTVLMRNPNNIPIQYSTNGTEFNDYTAETEVPINPSEKVYFKWSEVISNSSNSTALVSSNVKYKTYGELKQGNNKYAYNYMFFFNSNLIDASGLNLTSTTSAESSYQRMFTGCSSLTTAPEIFATTLRYNSFYYMFFNCTSLNYVKHHITEWNIFNTTDWLYNVAPSGTMYCPLNSTIPSNDDDGIPEGWTRVDF